MRLCGLICVLLTAAQAWTPPAQTGRTGCTLGQGPRTEGRFMREHIKCNTRMYQTFLEENKYSKQHKQLRARGKASHINIITVNVTSLSEAARKWLGEQTADVILLQEHHLYSKQAFGMIPGYTLVFSPAQKTMYSARGWETTGALQFYIARACST